VKGRKGFMIPSRIHVMEPDSDVNLNRFVESYNRAGTYYLMPAVIEKREVRLIQELAIKKNILNVKEAKNVGKHDIETVLLRSLRRG